MAQPAPCPLPTSTPVAAGSATPLGDVAGPEAAPDPDADPPPGLRPAVGYLCVPGDEDRINGLHNRLDVQARRAGLELLEVYVDRQPSVDESTRPGLSLAVAEIAGRRDAVLLVPDLSHLSTSREGWAAWEERFAGALTEIHTVSPAVIPAQTSCPWSVTALRRSGGETPVAEIGRVRLATQGKFEVTILPNEDVAGVVAVLGQVPADARFLESYGDVDTTLVFLTTPAAPLAAAQRAWLRPPEGRDGDPGDDTCPVCRIMSVCLSRFPITSTSSAAAGIRS
jgi:uncharacterized repeat protein (TIGR03917 family)